MDEKLERLKKWRDEDSAPPYIMDLSPTDLCNLNCKSCWQRNPKFSEPSSDYEISDQRLLELIDEALKLGVEKFEITGGGEPLIRKEVVTKLMKKIKNADKRGNITTNGTFMDRKFLDNLLEFGWDSITFSLDAPDKPTNDFLRGEGSFRSIISSLKYLKDKKESEVPSTKFNVVISNKNYKKLEEMIELADKLNVSIVSFETLTVHSKKGEKLKLNEEQRQELVQNIPDIKERASKAGIETNIGNLAEKYFQKSNDMDDILEKEGRSDFFQLACYEPWYHIVVKVDGSVQPCCLYDLKKENVKQKSLREIWFGETFRNIRESIKNRNFSDFCKICNASQVLANKEIQEKLQKV